MRVRFLLGSVMAIATAGVATAACIPEPTQDFEDYQTRLRAELAKTGTGDAGPTIEAGPPPTQAVTGTYVAQCLTELANGQVSKIFTFWTTSSFTPSDTGGTLGLTLQAVLLVNKKPPTTISMSGFTGAPLPVITGTTDASGSFAATLPAGENASFPGLANPISGGDVVLSGAGLSGKFAEDHFCARLIGHVDQPAAAARQLDPDKNFCLFTPVKDGDPAPVHPAADYSTANCPL